MSQQFCPQCHAQLIHGAWMCPACGTPILSPDTDRTVLRSALPQESVSPGLISSVPGVASSASHGGTALAPPEGASPASSPVYPAATSQTPQVAVAPVSVMAPRSDASQKWLPRIAAVLALVGIGFVAWRVVGSGGGESSASETTNVETTTGGTDAAATVASTAPAVTESPVTTPPRPPWPAPPIPDPPIYAGFGLAYAISDPLIGGMPSDQPTPYLAFAQDVFNKMAADDWAGVAPVFSIANGAGGAVPYEFYMQSQWPAADRLSLLLVDAAPDPDGVGYDLTVAVVANFPGSASLLCGHLYSDPTSTMHVIQQGAFELLADGEAPYMPETLLNDPTRIADLQTRCA